MATGAVRGVKSGDPRYVPQEGNTFVCHEVDTSLTSWLKRSIGAQVGAERTIPFSYVNDNYCDCADGSDEPGTSACDDNRFECANQGSVPKTIWTSAIGDDICDCCDGSDEAANACPNTCFEDGAVYRQELQQQLKAHEDGLVTKHMWIQAALDKRQAATQKIVQLKAKLPAAKQAAVVLKLEKDAAEKIEDAHKATLKAKEEEEKKIEEAKKKEEESQAAEETPAQEAVVPPTEAAEETPKATEQLNANERQALALENACSTKVMVFGGSDFTGWQADYEVGSYPGALFMGGGAKDDETGSLKVPPGCVVHVYENADFTGWTAMFSTGEYTAGEMGAAGAHENAISAIRVKNEGDNSLPELPAAPVAQEVDSAATSQSPKVKCVMWRQTGGCDPKGPREPKQDKGCFKTVPDGPSGYCECADGVRRYEVGCSHSSFRCIDACDGKPLKDVPPPPPPPVVTSSNYKDPTANEARTKHSAAQSKVDGIEKEITESEKTASSGEYGANGEFLELVDQCFTLKKQQYKYEVCPFKSVKQDHTNLGNWGNWGDGHSTMQFTGGGSCWQGPSRSAKVRLHCGRETKVLTVDEPERCTYVLDMETPAACTADVVRELQAKIQEVSPNLKDEM